MQLERKNLLFGFNGLGGIFGLRGLTFFEVHLCEHLARGGSVGGDAEAASSPGPERWLSLTSRLSSVRDLAILDLSVHIAGHSPRK